MSARIIPLADYRAAKATTCQAQRLADRRTRLVALVQQLLRPAPEPIPFPGAALPLVVVPFTPRPGPGAA